MKKKFIFMFSAIMVIIISISLLGIGNMIYNKFFKKGTGPVLVYPEDEESTNILFLHHSTGKNIWNGGVEEWFKEYNRTNSTNYSIYEQNFPKQRPYGWKNYPYDYWNIWVNHQDKREYKEEPSLDLITENYDVVILKHCFPVSGIKEDEGEPDIGSEKKTLGNYKLQYGALLNKFHQYNDTIFIVWTNPALVEEQTNQAEAGRAREFHEWTVEEWDTEGDNVFLWDFYALETEGDLFMKEEYAKNSGDSHPNEEFSAETAPLFCNRIVDILEGRGDNSTLTGKTQ